MPKETKSVKAELRRVRFVDAETWKTPEKQAASPAEKAAAVKTLDAAAVKKATTPAQHELGYPVVMAHPKSSATQHRKKMPRMRLGRFAILWSFLRVSFVNSSFVLALCLVSSWCLR